MYGSINDTNLKISADPNTTFFNLMITQDMNILKAVGKFIQDCFYLLILHSYPFEIPTTSLSINSSVWNDFVRMLAGMLNHFINMLLVHVCIVIVTVILPITHIMSISVQ